MLCACVVVLFLSRDKNLNAIKFISCYFFCPVPVLHHILITGVWWLNRAGTKSSWMEYSPQIVDPPGISYSETHLLTN